MNYEIRAGQIWVKPNNMIVIIPVGDGQLGNMWKNSAKDEFTMGSIRGEEDLLRYLTQEKWKPVCDLGEIYNELPAL